MDLGEDWSNNEIIQAAAIGEFTSLDGIEWRNGAETAADEEAQLKVHRGIFRLMIHYGNVFFQKPVSFLRTRTLVKKISILISIQEPRCLSKENQQCFMDIRRLCSSCRNRWMRS